MLLDDEIHITVVKQQDLNLSSVIGVDNACAGVDEVLCRKSRSWCNPTVCLSISFRLPFAGGWEVEAEEGRRGEERRSLQVPAGTAIAKSVSANPFPLAGITVSLAA